MNIGIDIDDTISETYESFFTYAQKYILEDLKRNIEISDNGMIEHSYHYADMTKLSQEENTQFLEKYLVPVFNETKPKALADKYINKLQEDKNKIIIITSRREKYRDLTENWLKKYNINYDRLIMNCENKKESIEENNIDIFIDDNLNFCKEALNNERKVFMMDTRPNRNLELPTNIKRVFSWAHFYNESRRYI